MDDYNNQNQYPDNQNRGTSPDSSYDNNQDRQGQPWQNGPDSNPQGGQWQNGPSGGGSQWQNSPGGQWQNSSGNQWQNNQPYGQPPRQHNGKALASMIFGILALVACCVPFIQFPLAVVAIVLVILSKNRQPLTGFAIAGLVLGIIAIIMSIAMTIYWGYAFSLMNDPEFIQMYNDMMNMYQYTFTRPAADTPPPIKVRRARLASHVVKSFYGIICLPPATNTRFFTAQLTRAIPIPTYTSNS